MKALGTQLGYLFGYLENSPDQNILGKNYFKTSQQNILSIYKGLFTQLILDIKNEKKSDWACPDCQIDNGRNVIFIVRMTIVNQSTIQITNYRMYGNYYIQYFTHIEYDAIDTDGFKFESSTEHV